MPLAPAGTTGMEPSTALRGGSAARVGNPGWHCHSLPGGSGEQALAWRGVGVNRKEPASVSVPAGTPSQRFHSPTQNALQAKGIP